MTRGETSREPGLASFQVTYFFFNIIYYLFVVRSGRASSPTLHSTTHIFCNLIVPFRSRYEFTLHRYVRDYSLQNTMFRKRYLILLTSVVNVDLHSFAEKRIHGLIIELTSTLSTETATCDLLENSGPPLLQTNRRIPCDNFNQFCRKINIKSVLPGLPSILALG